MPKGAIFSCSLRSFLFLAVEFFDKIRCSPLIVVCESKQFCIPFFQDLGPPSSQLFLNFSWFFAFPWPRSPSFPFKKDLKSIYSLALYHLVLCLYCTGVQLACVCDEFSVVLSFCRPFPRSKSATLLARKYQVIWMIFDYYLQLWYVNQVLQVDWTLLYRSISMSSY